jgi:hypothetical protein
MKKGLRAVAVLTLTCFLTTQCVSAGPAAGIEITGGRELPAYLSIDVPAELGTVDALYEAPGGASPKFILHIQNAHANYQAQMKIKQLLQYMNKKYGFQTIFVEGASEKLDADYLRLFPDQERNLKLCDELAKQGELTGAELFLMEQSSASGERGTGNGSVQRLPLAVSRGEAVEALGIEQASLYKANYDALKKVFGAETDVTRFFKGFDAKLDKVASKTFTPETRELIADWKRFEQGRREFMPFVKSLTVKSKKVLNVDLESLFAQVGWPQISRLLVIQQMEKELDKTKGLEEKAALIRMLRTKGVTKELIATLESFNEGSIAVGKSASEVSPREVLERLAQEAGSKGFKFSDYPAFSLFAGYVTLRSELDPKVLFEEIEYLFTQMLDTLAQDPQQKTLLALYRDGELLRKLLHLELNRTQWRELLANRDQIAIPSLVARLKAAVQLEDQRPTANDQRQATADSRQSIVDGRQSNAVMPPAFAATMDGLFTAGLEFYDFAHQREAVFYKEMQSQMQEKKITKAILITGGFHTDGMSDLFRENAVSYGIVTPRLSEKSDENLYQKIMLQNEQVPFSLSYLEAAPHLADLVTIENQGLVPVKSLKPILKQFISVGNFGSLDSAAVSAFNSMTTGPTYKGVKVTLELLESNLVKVNVARAETRIAPAAPVAQSVTMGPITATMGTLSATTDQAARAEARVTAGELKGQVNRDLARITALLGKGPRDNGADTGLLETLRTNLELARGSLEGKDEKDVIEPDYVDRIRKGELLRVDGAIQQVELALLRADRTKRANESSGFFGEVITNLARNPRLRNTEDVSLAGRELPRIMFPGASQEAGVSKGPIDFDKLSPARKVVVILFAAGFLGVLSRLLAGTPTGDFQMANIVPVALLLSLPKIFARAQSTGDDLGTLSFMYAGALVLASVAIVSGITADAVGMPFGDGFAMTGFMVSVFVVPWLALNLFRRVMVAYLPERAIREIGKTWKLQEPYNAKPKEGILLGLKNVARSNDYGIVFRFVADQLAKLVEENTSGVIRGIVQRFADVREMDNAKRSRAEAKWKPFADDYFRLIDTKGSREAGVSDETEPRAGAVRRFRSEIRNSFKTLAAVFLIGLSALTGRGAETRVAAPADLPAATESSIKVHSSAITVAGNRFVRTSHVVTLEKDVPELTVTLQSSPTALSADFTDEAMLIDAGLPAGSYLIAIKTPDGEVTRFYRLKVSTPDALSSLATKAGAKASAPSAGKLSSANLGELGRGEPVTLVIETEEGPVEVTISRRSEARSLADLKALATEAVEDAYAIVREFSGLGYDHRPTKSMYIERGRLAKERAMGGIRTAVDAGMMLTQVRTFQEGIVRMMSELTPEQKAEAGKAIAILDAVLRSEARSEEEIEAVLATVNAELEKIKKLRDGKLTADSALVSEVLALQATITALDKKVSDLKAELAGIRYPADAAYIDAVVAMLNGDTMAPELKAKNISVARKASVDRRPTLVVSYATETGEPFSAIDVSDLQPGSASVVKTKEGLWLELVVGADTNPPSYIPLFMPVGTNGRPLINFRRSEAPSVMKTAPAEAVTVPGTTVARAEMRGTSERPTREGWLSAPLLRNAAVMLSFTLLSGSALFAFLTILTRVYGRESAQHAYELLVEAGWFAEVGAVALGVTLAVKMFLDLTVGNVSVFKKIAALWNDLRNAPAASFKSKEIALLQEDILSLWVEIELNIAGMEDAYDKGDKRAFNEQAALAEGVLRKIETKDLSSYYSSRVAAYRAKMQALSDLSARAEVRDPDAVAQMVTAATRAEMRMEDEVLSKIKQKLTASNLELIGEAVMNADPADARGTMKALDALSGSLKTMAGNPWAAVPGNPASANRTVSAGDMQSLIEDVQGLASYFKEKMLAREFKALKKPIYPSNAPKEAKRIAAQLEGLAMMGNLDAQGASGIEKALLENPKFKKALKELDKNQIEINRLVGNRGYTMMLFEEALKTSQALSDQRQKIHGTIRAMIDEEFARSESRANVTPIVYGVQFSALLAGQLSNADMKEWRDWFKSDPDFRAFLLSQKKLLEKAVGEKKGDHAFAAELLAMLKTLQPVESDPWSVSLPTAPATQKPATARAETRSVVEARQELQERVSPLLSPKALDWYEKTKPAFGTALMADVVWGITVRAEGISPEDAKRVAGIMEAFYLAKLSGRFDLAIFVEQARPYVVGHPLFAVSETPAKMIEELTEMPSDERLVELVLQLRMNPDQAMVWIMKKRQVLVKGAVQAKFDAIAKALGATAEVGKRLHIQEAQNVAQAIQTEASKTAEEETRLVPTVLVKNEKMRQALLAMDGLNGNVLFAVTNDKLAAVQRAVSIRFSQLSAKKKITRVEWEAIEAELNKQLEGAVKLDAEGHLMLDNAALAVLAAVLSELVAIQATSVAA